ncbi:P-loop containing nucleoside triphosphate hydrolase [Phytophthora cactorum]|nr:P-loop containing nucleoside triphosphate hydrolase [Phytophthora cactorum]
MCGLRSEGDLTLYCRPQVHELWAFLRNEVIVKNARGFILGPSGTGKSVSTLSFAASLDHHEWNVVWIHLCEEWSSYFLSTGINLFWKFAIGDEVKLPRVLDKKLFICVDEYDYNFKSFLSSIYAQLREDDRLVICSSMSALGHRSLEADRRVNLQVFLIYSWTQDEYLAAIADQVFYSKVMDFFDATNAFEVNDEGGDDVELSDDDTKKPALALKFYYAGGSCRFMFQYPTEDVKPFWKERFTLLRAKPTWSHIAMVLGTLIQSTGSMECKLTVHAIQGNWKLLQPVAWPRKLRYVVFQHGRKKSHLYPGGSIGQAPSQDALLSRGFTQAGSGRNDNFGCGDLFCGQGD